MRRLSVAAPWALAGSIWMALACCAGAQTMTVPEARMDAKVYDRASRFLADKRDVLVLNGTVSPHWREGAREGFTYRKALGDGRTRFVFVEAATGKTRTAFDHDPVAAGLGQALGKPVDAAKLPFKDYDQVGADAIRFTLDGKVWTCSTDKPGCTGTPAPTPNPLEVLSPDGKWAAFVKDYNLWIRPTDGGAAFALTTDGEEHYAYAATPEGTSAVVPPAISGKPLPPAVLWSPDSRRIWAPRLDQRQVREISLFQSSPLDGSVRPKVFSWRYALPNDPAVPMEHPYLFDIAAQHGAPAGVDPFPALFMTSVGMKQAFWSHDGRTVFLLAQPRYFKTATLYAVDAVSGHAQALISDTGKTFVEFAPIGFRPLTQVLADGSVIWFSERDGHGHLYLHDAAGKFERRLTQGDWSVRAIVRVDEKAGWIYFLASAREVGDPYYVRLYRLRLATGAIELLTPEPAEHEIGSPLIAMLPPALPPVATPEARWSFSPSGRYFLDTFSRPDTPPTTVLRRADGGLVATVEQADISRLKVGGFTAPERFTALAADGKTALYGNILRPSDFDPAKHYPVLDSIYPGPQSRRVRADFMSVVYDPFDAQAVAELGFIVVTVDGRGTPGRSKAFLDQSYGKLAEAGNLQDHVSAIKQLAKRYPSMDLDRVGIYGFSGGGYASTHAMLVYPDFFKVAVSGSGNHDQRGYLAIWGETYNGPEVDRNYLDTSNALLAANLKGKLMLMHGEADYNVNPALTMQLVGALIKANKDFDLVIQPNVPHTVTPYARRRTWDYLVRNLAGIEPPATYTFTPPATASH